MIKLLPLCLLMFACHAEVSTLSDPTETRISALKALAGDFDGNGIIDWHDAYLYDHCVNLCPECCVTVAVEEYADLDAATHCPPSECPGKECQCVKGVDNVWYLSPEVGD